MFISKEHQGPYQRKINYPSGGGNSAMRKRYVISGDFDYSKLDYPSDKKAKGVNTVQLVVTLDNGCKLYSLVAYKKILGSRYR